MAIRLQVALYDRLQMEVIVESLDEATRIYAAWSSLKSARGLPWGGAASRDTRFPRTWDVPVGSHIQAPCGMCMTQEGDRRDSEPIRTCQNAFFQDVICGSCSGRCPECLRPLVRDRSNGDALTCPKQLEWDDEPVY